MAQNFTFFTCHVGHGALTSHTQAPMFAALDGMLRSGRGGANG